MRFGGRHRRGRREEENLVSSQRSRWVSPALYSNKEGTSPGSFATGMYTHMFIDDAGLHIMPIAGRSENPAFSVAIDPASVELTQIILEAIPSRGSRHDLASTISDFFRELM